LSSGVKFAFVNGSNLDDLFTCSIEDYFVSKSSGNNANDCKSTTSACLTISGAIAKVPAAELLARVIVIGSYPESTSTTVTINGKDVHVGGRNRTTDSITSNSGGSSGEAFSVSGGKIFDLFDLTLIQGNTSGTGIFVLLNSGKASVRNCIVRSGTVSGSAYAVSISSFLSVKNGSAIITGCQFSQLNYSTCILDVLGTVDSSSVSISSSTFNRIISSEGGVGVIIGDNGTGNSYVISSTSFTNITKTSTSLGGLVNLNGTVQSVILIDSNIINITFSGGSVVLGGGVYVRTAVSISLTNLIISGVSGVGSGGGVYIETCENIKVSGSQFENINVSGSGGGIFFGGGSKFNITSTYFGSLNCGNGYGGGIFSNSTVGGNRYLIDVEFSDNSVFENKGNDICDNSSGVFNGGYYSLSSISGCTSDSDEIRFYLAALEISMDCFLLDGCLSDEISISGTSGMDVVMCGLFFPCQTVEYSYNILQGSGKFKLIDSGIYLINQRNLSGQSVEYAGNVQEGQPAPTINTSYGTFVWMYLMGSNLTVSNVKLLDESEHHEQGLLFVGVGISIFKNVEFVISNIYVSYFLLSSNSSCPLTLNNCTISNVKVYFGIIFDNYDNNVTINSSTFANITTDYPIDDYYEFSSGGVIYEQHDYAGNYKLSILYSVIENVSISDNKTLIFFGGGLSGSDFTITNSIVRNVTFDESSVTNYLIYLNRSIPAIRIRNSTFSFLSGSYRGGAVYLSCQGVSTTNTTHIFSNCTFLSNQGVMGGAIYINQINIYFSNCSFVNNSVIGCGYVDGVCTSGHDIHVEGGSGTFYSSSTFRVFFFLFRL
jgi:hypothetical protein